jgi:hypothetical protein
VCKHARKFAAAAKPSHKCPNSNQGFYLFNFALLCNHKSLPGLVCYNAGKCVQDPSKPDQETCACASECHPSGYHCGLAWL